MINIEPELYNKVAELLRTKYGEEIFVTNAPVSMPDKFPAVCISEGGNTTNRNTLDSSNTENHSNVAWEIEVYSNDQYVGRYECKQIAVFVNSLIIDHNFTRTFGDYVPNADKSITRYVLRYTATVGKDKTIYRRS